MKTDTVTIQHLLENRQRFCVPIYQRHFVWTREKQWEPFWNDVRAKAIERITGRERRFSHFLGALVVEARDAASSKRSLRIRLSMDSSVLRHFNCFSQRRTITRCELKFRIQPSASGDFFQRPCTSNGKP